ncbi:hypothetical protein [Chitinimonas arctica]|nr:hypothetical protein [Chitinimonas arctica]
MLGLPVFGNAESGGWAGPSLFGWLCAILFWAVAWWIFVQAVVKLRS